MFTLEDHEEIELVRHGNGMGWSIKGCKTFERLDELHKKAESIWGNAPGFMQRKKSDEEFKEEDRNKKIRQAMAIRKSNRR